VYQLAVVSGTASASYIKWIYESCVMELLEALNRHWGYASFRPNQEDAMACVMGDRDSVVVLPTGGGKSLCYQAPAVCRGGLAIVISPLISLMKDQVDSLRTSGVPAAFINSSQSDDERRKVADAVRSGELRLLYIAPERLVQQRTIDFLKGSNVTFFAIDEAHCISEWGHDFRPEYRSLKMLREQFPGVALHAYTATATEQVRADIIQQLGLKDSEMLVGSFDRPNLFFRTERMDDRMAQVREVLRRHKRESGIIYCTSRKAVDELCELLNAQGFRTLPYHAGMNADARSRNQEAFIQESVDTIVATVAFGMGIDKSNVRYVIHCGMPKSLENYQQESGRAGRDGLDADCVLFYSMADYARWKSNIDGSSAGNREASHHTLRAMVDYCTGVRCRHRSLVEYFGQDFESESCNACDVCAGELDVVDDALVIGQKILSGVVRQGQRYGGEYTAMVLKGSRDQRVRSNGHDKLSTWGILEDQPVQTIRDWIEQLVSQDFLVRIGEYSILNIGPRGGDLLRGEVIPTLLRASDSQVRLNKQVARQKTNWEGVDRELFDELRILRHDLAAQAGVPAYIVFTDETLRHFARIRPSTLAGMRAVHGVGDKRLADYGDAFLACITQYCRQSGTTLDNSDERMLSLDADSNVAARNQSGEQVVSNSARQPADETRKVAVKGSSSTKPAAFELFREGHSVDQVAARLERAVSTVRGYLNEFIDQEGLTDPDPWLSAEDLARIQVAISECESDRLKPIFEKLDGEVSYDDIRIAVSLLRNRAEAVTDRGTYRDDTSSGHV
jgi:ATP-dependent DNA helicase RecQ